MAQTDGHAAAKSGWDVFLSYGSHDVAVVGRVQRFLERYRLPGGRRLKVYRDETDIAGGELPAQLREAMAESRCLVVCCSNAAAESDWVIREIEMFRELAPERLILPVLVANDPPANLPPPLRAVELRWSDLRKGWRLGLPRRETREELVRVVAAAAGMDFRKLLPLDRRRRRRTIFRVTAAIASALVVSAWFPVQDWVDETPKGTPVFGCDTLDDGIALFRMNEPQAIKNIVDVQRDAFGPAPQIEILGPELVPRGRLLPESIGGKIRKICGGSGSGWAGEPVPGTCVRLSESEQIGFFADPMGGGEAPLTDVAIGSEESVLDRFWKRIDHQRWGEYGRTIQPSDGLPIAVDGGDMWLGFPDDEITRGQLWHTTNSGQSWKVERGITDVRSVRHLSLGVVIAARRDRELGFYLRRNGIFEPFDVPGKGDQLEVCGEVDGQPVVRVDRNVFRRVQRPWWRAQL